MEITSGEDSSSPPPSKPTFMGKPLLSRKEFVDAFAKTGPSREDRAAPFRRELRKHWSATNVKQARFDSFCQKCRLTISLGDPIIFHFELRRFVHAWCAPTEQTSSTPYAPTTPAAVPAQAEETHPYLFAESSRLNELSTAYYRREAVRWVQFFAACKLIPGIHTPFTDISLKAFMEHRAKTTKAMNHISSALKKMGSKFGHILHNSSAQQPSIQYQRLNTTKSDIAKTLREQGLDAATKQSLGVGEFGLSMLCAAFDLRSQKRMARLHPWHQMGMAITSGMHAYCGRFGLYKDTDPSREDLQYASHEQAHHLMTIWRKTKKSNRPYALRIPCRPPRNSAARYVIPGPRGPSHVSAGHIWTWYLANMGLTNAPGSAPLFPLLMECRDRREAYCHWLRTMFTLALPVGSQLPARITPHSMRAGWVSDQTRRQVPVHTIMAQGRWSSTKAFRDYIRPCIRDLSTSNRFRLIPDEVREQWPPQE